MYNKLSTSLALVTFRVCFINLLSGSSDTYSMVKSPNVILSPLFGQYMNEASCMRRCFNMLHKFFVNCYLFVFLQLAQHYNSITFVLPYHLPEISHCWFHGTWSHYECFTVPISLNKNQRCKLVKYYVVVALTLMKHALMYPPLSVSLTLELSAKANYP